MSRSFFECTIFALNKGEVVLYELQLEISVEMIVCVNYSGDYIVVGNFSNVWKSHQ